MICEVSKASAEVTWYKGDEELQEGVKYECIQDGRKRILIIQDLHMGDAGEYNCKLPNTKTSGTLKINGNFYTNMYKSHSSAGIKHYNVGGTESECPRHTDFFM